MLREREREKFTKDEKISSFFSLIECILETPLGSAIIQGGSSFKSAWETLAVWRKENLDKKKSHYDKQARFQNEVRLLSLAFLRGRSWRQIVWNISSLLSLTSWSAAASLCSTQSELRHFEIGTFTLSPLSFSFSFSFSLTLSHSLSFSLTHTYTRT